MKLEREGIEILEKESQKTGLWDMAFIWFCANVAVPRLMIGGSLSGLGFRNMLLAIIIGNIFVFLPLLMLGHIGYTLRIPTMALTRITFGIKGSYIPSLANGIQLLGWGANVTVICGASINISLRHMTGFDNVLLWIVATGILQLLITAYGFRSIKWLQRLSVPLLLILTIITAVLLFKKYGFSSIVSYSPLVPLSFLVGIDILAGNAFAWGPLVCDYTRYSNSSKSASLGTLFGSLAGAASFMFVGAISAISTGEANPINFLLDSGLGIPALLIIVLSSITTNVINIYSSSISFVNIFPKVQAWKIILPVGIITTAIAAVPNLIGYFISFLIIVGSIFVPLIAILLVDYFLIKKQHVEENDIFVENKSSKYWYQNGYNIKAILVWIVGILLYNGLYYYYPKFGSSLPTFVIICLLYFVVSYREVIRNE